MKSRTLDIWNRNMEMKLKKFNLKKIRRKTCSAYHFTKERGGLRALWAFNPMNDQSMLEPLTNWLLTVKECGMVRWWIQCNGYSIWSCKTSCGGHCEALKTCSSTDGCLNKKGILMKGHWKEGGKTDVFHISIFLSTTAQAHDFTDMVLWRLTALH